VTKQQMGWRIWHGDMVRLGVYSNLKALTRNGPGRGRNRLGVWQCAGTGAPGHCTQYRTLALFKNVQVVQALHYTQSDKNDTITRPKQPSPVYHDLILVLQVSFLLSR
jgi:hypothetical protein